MNECAHSWQSDLSLPNDNACDLDEGHEKATSGRISFLSWGLFPLSSLSGQAGDVHSDLLLHDALHASAFHGQLLGDGSQGCDEGTFRGESSCYYWSWSTMLHVDDHHQHYHFYHLSLLLDNDYIDHHQVRALARAAGPSHVLGSRGKVRSPFFFKILKLEQLDGGIFFFPVNVVILPFP